LEFDKVDYNLIAYFHRRLQTYFINQKLPINLSKSNEESSNQDKKEKQHFQDLIIMIQKMEFLGI
jgi:hypothetical protein